MRRRQFLTGLTGIGIAGVALGSQVNTAHAQARSARTAQAARTAAAKASWTEVQVPEVRGAARLASVAAESAEQAWAVGSQLHGDDTQPDAALALRWDGDSWTETDTEHLGRNGGLRSVSAGGAGNTWAIAHGPEGEGQLLAWDGTTWQHTPYPGEGEPGATLKAVLAESDGEAWAVGSGGGGAEPGLLHWDGTAWRWTDPLPADTSSSLLGLSRAPDGSVWVHGEEAIARWDGAWTPIEYLAPIRSSITGLVPTAPDDVWLVGWAYGVGGPPGKPPGVVLRHYDGSEWTSPDTPFSPGALMAVHANAQGTAELMGGWDFWEQTSAHYALLESDGGDGPVWVSERGPDAGEGSSVTPNDLAAIPGTTGGYWSVGYLNEEIPRIERRA